MATTNTNRWKLGLFVTLGCALLAGSVLWVGISQLQRRTAPAYFYFDETVNGLEIGSPVKFRGVTIGSVEEIMPAPDRRHIEVEAGLYIHVLENFGIDPQEFEPRSGRTSFVSDDLRAQLVTSALTSISFIQIDVFDPPPPKPEYTFPTPWETIPTTQSTFKSLETGLTDALERLPAVSEKAEALLVSLDQGIADLQLARLSSEVTETLEAGRALMGDLSASPLVDRQSRLLAELERALVGIADVAEGLRGPGGQVERVVARFDAAGAAIQADFEDSDIPAAVLSMERAGESLSGTNLELATLLREMRGGLDRFQAVLLSLQELSDMIARDPGSLLHGRSARTLPFRR